MVQRPVNEGFRFIRVIWVVRVIRVVRVTRVIRVQRALNEGRRAGAFGFTGWGFKA